MRDLLRRLHTSEDGDSPVEHVLLLALVVVPLMGVVPLIFMSGNAVVFDRTAPWVDLHFP